MATHNYFPYPSWSPVCLRPVQSSSSKELSYYKETITVTGLVCTSTKFINVTPLTDPIDTI